MCGIAGTINPAEPPDTELLARMARHLKSRGPDEYGSFLDRSTGMAHCRLSIIDLSSGQQPMSNEDQSLTLVFNGEIYDYSAWRRRLQAKGHRFRTDSDSEILLHLYEDHGPEMLPSLNGMFAFAIWDRRRRELFMARDRLGQKPLFYAHAGQRLAFASGPAALRELAWVDTDVDPQAIDDYLEFLYIPEPRSIHRGIQKLSPGSWARFHGGHLSCQRYWQAEVTADFPGDYADAQAALQDCLRAAVQRRLVADVPLGLFLSGGLDSSIICALAQQARQGAPARTFSIGFAERRYDEREYAARVARHLGTDHTELTVEPGDFAHLEEVVRAFEEPFADSSMLPTALLAKFTREHVTVALSGDAADELFGGYYRYRVYHLCRLLRICPKKFRSVIRKALMKLLPPMTEERSFTGKLRRLINLGDVEGLDQYLRIISRFPACNRRAIYGPRLRDASLRPSLQVLQGKVREPVDVDAVMELELSTYLCDDILVKVDRASMAHSLEVRSPFLDPAVVDLALQLPYRFKQHGMERKRILGDCFADLLPPGIRERRKMGFGVPVATWLRHGWRCQAKDLLLGGRLVQDGWFDQPGLESLLKQHLNREADNSYPLFALLVLELWFQGLDPGAGMADR